MSSSHLTALRLALASLRAATAAEKEALLQSAATAPAATPADPASPSGDRRS